MSMQAILSASLSLSRTQVVQSANTKMKGSVNVLKAELKQDGGNEQKEQKIKELEEQSAKLTGNMMDDLKDVNNTLKPEENTKPESDKETGKPENTDQVELSKPSDGETGQKATVSGEAVIYNAEGNQMKAAPAPTGEKINVAA